MKRLQFTLVTAFALYMGACAQTDHSVRARPSGTGASPTNPQIAQLAQKVGDSPSVQKLVLQGTNIQADIMCLQNLTTSPTLKSIALQGGSRVIFNMPQGQAAAGSQTQTTTPSATDPTSTDPSTANTSTANNNGKRLVRPLQQQKGATLPWLNIGCAGQSDDLSTMSNNDISEVNMTVDSTNNANVWSESVKLDVVTDNQIKLNVICLAAGDSKGASDAFQKGADLAMAAGSKILLTNASTDTSAKKYFLLNCTDGSATPTPTTPNNTNKPNSTDNGGTQIAGGGDTSGGDGGDGSNPPSSSDTGAVTNTNGSAIAAAAKSIAGNVNNQTAATVQTQGTDNANSQTAPQSPGGVSTDPGNPRSHN